MPIPAKPSDDKALDDAIKRMQQLREQYPPTLEGPPTTPPIDAERDSVDRTRRLIEPGNPQVVVPSNPADDSKTTDDLIQRLGREVREQAPVAPLATALKEDPAVSCYRKTQARVTDRHGVVHDTSLYDQLVSALGIPSAQLEPLGTNECRADAYDCKGSFFGSNGAPVQVPAFPAGANSDAAVNAWKASVTRFYDGAYTDAKGTKRLSPGKAALCAAWAEVFFQAKPDPSLLEAFELLEEIGAEQLIQQDTRWLDGIVSAGAAKGCGTLPLPPNHSMDDWLVPQQSAQRFHKGFRDCTKPDANGVGGCPHSFDNVHGNHVNARFLFDAETPQCGRAAVFLGD